MALSQQNRYLLFGIAIVLLLWRFNQLPRMLAQQLDAWMPKTIADIVKGSPAVTAPDESAAGCPPQGKCEEFRTNTQCGICPSACQWIENKCRSRGITPEEKNA